LSQQPQPKKDEGLSVVLGCFGLVLLVILLFAGCSALINSSDSDSIYDDTDTYETDSGEDNFEKATKQLQEEIDQEEKYGDEISDLDNK
jgi:hypothetical protein